MSPRPLDYHVQLHTLLISAEVHCLLILKLVGMLILIHVTAACPLDCYCFTNTGLVQCHFLSLQEIPREIPHWVQNLSIIGSHIAVLRTAAFVSNRTHLVNLTSLILSNNSIQTIEALAFHGLPSLTTLDLSYNLLSSIANDTFLGQTQLQVLKLNHALQKPAPEQLFNSQWIMNLRSLRILEMASNALQLFPSVVLALEDLQVLNIGNNSLQVVDAETISALSNKSKLWVYLSPNPLVCDCQIATMLYWLRNTSQVLDAQSLTCNAPVNLNGTHVTKLNPEDLKCQHKDLKTASYVFLGIVLALIGVIFLMVLYLNRRGMKKWVNNFREACRDQMEGYHYRYEQDSDPRRSNISTGI
ncbi:hypothetical protein FKM82_009948 [Ascaphus truei]